MKKILLLLSLFAFVFVSQAQFSNQTDMYARYKTLTQSKTYGVLYGNEKYDEALKKAMTTYWKLTPVDFINIEDLPSKLGQPYSNFVLFLKGENEFHVKATYLALVNGGTSPHIDDYTYEKFEAFAPIDELEFEKDQFSCAPRVKNMIQGMQLTINYLKMSISKGSSYTQIHSILDKKNNVNKFKIPYANVLVPRKYFSESYTEQQFVERYSKMRKKFEVLNDGDFEQRIQKDDAPNDVYISVINNNAHKYIIVTACKTGEVIYLEKYQTVSERLKEHMIKSMLN